MSTPNSVKTALKITAEVDPVAARRTFDEIVRSGDEANDRLRQSGKKLQHDLEGYGDESARSATRAVLESVNAQIESWERAKSAAAAYGSAMMELRKNVAEGANPQYFSEQQRKVWDEGLAAEKKELQKALQRQEASARAEKDQASTEAATRGSAVGFAGGLLGKMKDDGPGGETLGSMTNGIKEIASSKTVWEGLLNTSKAILNVAVDMYNSNRRRIQEQTLIAGGSQQFARYAGQKGLFEQSVVEQIHAEYAKEFTDKERSSYGVVARGVQVSSQSGMSVSSAEFKKQMEELAVTSSFLGKEWGQFGKEVGEISRRTGAGFTEILNTFAEAGAAVGEYNKKFPHAQLNAEEFTTSMMHMTMALKDMRYSASDARAITEKWAQEIDKGTLTYQELNAAMRGAGRGDRGAMAFSANKVGKRVGQSLEAKLTAGTQGTATERAKQAAKEIKDLIDSQTSPGAKGEILRKLGDDRNVADSEYWKSKGLSASGSDAESMEIRRRTQREVNDSLVKQNYEDATRLAGPKSKGKEGEWDMRFEQIFESLQASSAFNVVGKGFGVYTRAGREGYSADATPGGTQLPGLGGPKGPDIATTTADILKEVRRIRGKQDSVPAKLKRTFVKPLELGLAGVNSSIERGTFLRDLGTAFKNAGTAMAPFLLPGAGIATALSSAAVSSMFPSDDKKKAAAEAARLQEEEAIAERGDLAGRSRVGGGATRILVGIDPNTKKPTAEVIKPDGEKLQATEDRDAMIDDMYQSNGPPLPSNKR